MAETIIRAAEAPKFGEEGTDVTGYASPSRGSNTVSAWRIALSRGAGSPLHSLDTDQVFLVLSGCGTFEVEGRRHEVRAGDSISVPPELTFRLANEREETFEAIACMAAGGRGRIGDGEPFVPPWAA
jgi:quercetin dioxygenase-like cupin family protein